MSLDSCDPSTTPANPAERLSMPSTVYRRRLLVGGAVATMAAALAACGTEKAAAPTTSSAPSETAEAEGGARIEKDLALAELAAGLEVLAVQTYTAFLDAGAAGKLGEVPPANTEAVTTARNHHQEQLKAWNAMLTGAGRREVTKPNAKLKPTVDEGVAKATDVVGAAKVGVMLEQVISQTYLKAIPTLRNKDAIRMAGSFQIIDQQYLAILYYSLGMYPVPEVFQPTDKALIA